MSVHRRGVYTRDEIKILQVNEGLRTKELDAYEILKFDETFFREEFLAPTTNLIILNLIWARHWQFLTELQFKHAIDKVITYSKSTDLLFIEDIFRKLNGEIIGPYLHMISCIAKEV